LASLRYKPSRRLTAPRPLTIGMLAVRGVASGIFVGSADEEHNLIVWNIIVISAPIFKADPRNASSGLHRAGQKSAAAATLSTGFIKRTHIFGKGSVAAMASNRVLIGPAPMRALERIWGPPLAAAGLVPVLPARAAQMTESELLAQLPGCVASLAGSEPYTPRVLEAAAAAGLKIVARAGVGYDAVDVAAATALGIVVGYAPGSNHEAVAEHTMLSILAHAKRLMPQHSLTRSGQWPRKAQRPVRGSTIGIVGLGRVGKAVALRANAFDMTVIATEPFPDQDFVARQGIRLLPLAELLGTADWVSLHCPLTPETRHLMRRETLALMKPTAFLINTARGEIVHEPDLAAALSAQQIAGAALDVFENEPLSVEHPLCALENVILSAHTAGVDTQSQENMVRFAAECIADVMRGEWPAERIVNPEVRPQLARTPAKATP
jgi:D-3-phosphoglycerate dehydrogenase / 2-oxoglutarate reductase